MTDHPSLAIRHFNIAVAFEGLKRFEEAISHVTRAVEILQQTKGPDTRKIQHYRRYLDELRGRL